MIIKLEDLQHFRHKSGVYFLIKQKDDIDEIVYIGQSRDIYTRILEHSYEGKKVFDTVRAIEIKDDDLRLLVETLMIFGYMNPCGYNIDILEDLDSLDIDLLVSLYLNDYYNAISEIKSTGNKFKSKLSLISFKNLYVFAFYRLKNNTIMLENELKECFSLYINNLKRFKNEYKQLHR